jgi:outer membrane biosynthesis protein TonB
MKLIGVISTAVLSLTLGVAAPAYAQQEQHDQQEEQKAKPAQDEKQTQAAKSAQQEEKPATQQEKSTKPEEKNAQQEKNTKQEERTAQQAKPEQQAQHAAGGRIPADKFKANFGQQHTFRVTQADYSNHRFQYGGYSFGFVDPWPSNWLYTQNVYVIEINGVYYLCNASFPGVNLALSFTP